MKTKVKQWVRRNLITLILMLIMAAGLCLLVYPTFSDWWNSFHQTRAIASYVEQTKDMTEEEYAAILKKAEEYNERLMNKGGRYNMSEADAEEYNSILDVSSTGIMGYIQIKKIGVNLPVYHGTDEAVLQIAIGHLAGTSLPVGGKGTHCAVSGHRGLPSAKLFTDIDQLVEGDTFTLTVLNRTCTYEVDQIRIVLPSELSDLNIDPAQDYCTLVTCTPYGVNSHRLLVRGHRIENIAGDVVVTAEAVKIPGYIVGFAIGIPILFVLLVIMLIVYRRRK